MRINIRTGNGTDGNNGNDRTEINNRNRNQTGFTQNNYQTKRRLYLSSAAVLRYLIGNDEKLETLIICKNAEFSLETDDQALYEAMGSIKPYDDFKLVKLTKLFEVVTIVSGKRHGILTDERVEELRREALRNQVTKQ